METELFIVRHGQSEGNRDKRFTGHGPSQLTELGRAQARAVAERLGELGIAVVYASDLPRAMATAEPFCARSGITPIATPAIRERDMGAYTGALFDDIAANDPVGWKALRSRDPAFRPPNGESHAECAARVGGFLDALLSTSSGRIALFSHGIAIHHMLMHLMCLGPESARKFVFTVDNCSIQHIEVRADRSVRICRINDIGHLRLCTG